MSFQQIRPQLSEKLSNFVTAEFLQDELFLVMKAKSF